MCKFYTVSLVNDIVGWCNGEVDIAPENLHFDTVVYDG